MAFFICFISTTFIQAQTSPSEPEGTELVQKMRQGGLVLFLRHADTTGMPCDRLYQIDQREGQRNISEDGKTQSAEIGQAIVDLDIPIQYSVLTGPVFRVRDTAEIAFGVENVEITDSLLADDYAGSLGVQWVLNEHRRLFSEKPDPGLNRILIGHRTPAIWSLDGQVVQSEFPEGAAIVIEPIDGEAYVHGIISFVSPPNTGVDRC